jgi:hypothetical protein
LPLRGIGVTVVARSGQVRGAPPGNNACIPHASAEAESCGHASADVEKDFGHLPQGNFVQRLWQLQGAYAWNPNLVLSSFIQYDTTSQNIGTNARSRWTIKPGNDLFIV